LELRALGDSEIAVGDKPAAKAAYLRAVVAARELETEAQPEYLPDLEGKVARL